MDPVIEDMEFQNDAIIFIRRMLNDIKELLPYGNVRYASFTRSFCGEPLPKSFILLRQFNSEIPRSPPLHNFIFDSTFKELAMFNDESVLLEQCPTYISLFIEYLKACILHVRNPQSIEHQFSHNSRFHAYPTRPSTQESTWGSYANVWEDAIEKWTKFLNLFNVVYNFVLQCDFVNALITLVQYSPSCIKFWRYFWNKLIFSGNISHQRYTRFQRLLNEDILPGLIHPANTQRDRQLNYCTRGLQDTEDELQDIIRDNHYPDAASRFDRRLFDRKGVNEALRLTRITLMPHESLIGEGSRQIAHYHNSREMAASNNVVYFSQRA